MITLTLESHIHSIATIGDTLLMRLTNLYKKLPHQFIQKVSCGESRP